MSRTGRKRLVGKREENRLIYYRVKQLTALEQSLHRAWQWCGNSIIPIWSTTSCYINRSIDSTNSKEAD